VTLHLHQLSVTHQGRPLVDVEDVRLEPGRPLTIVGESGSGKSILAHAIMGTQAAELTVTGRMTLSGTAYDLADPGNRRGLWGRELALLPQEPALALDPTMRVSPQVAEGVRSDGSRDDARRRADQRLDDVGLAHAARAFPHTLSGGMAQRVAHAAATIGGARVLIVDEPSKGLDSQALERLAQLLRTHAERGGLLLTITHDLGLARRLGGDLMVMRQAGVVERGTAAGVLAAPVHDYTQRLLGAHPSRWRHGWMDDAPVEGSPLVTASGLGKAYGDNVLFRDLSLQIGAGERWALTGPSGTGKTTLGNVLLRLTPADSGTVTHAPTLAGGRVQKLYQDPALSFPAKLPLALGLADLRRRHGVARDRLDSLLDAVGLPEELLLRRPHQVSGGELQRLAVVRAMLLGPALVFADEATSRLDLITQEVTMGCLMDQVSESGCALLLVTHDRDLAATVSHQHLQLGDAETPARSTVLVP
jgi:peptide/nickel transport system ATP-binding protein